MVLSGSPQVFWQKSRAASSAASPAPHWVQQSNFERVPILPAVVIFPNGPPAPNHALTTIVYWAEDRLDRATAVSSLTLCRAILTRRFLSRTST
jgi:hypothetical protein